MKKKFSLVAAMLALLMAFSPLLGCKAPVANDANTLEIYLTEAGYGIEWLNELEKEFEKQYPEVNVVITSDRGVELAVNKLSLGPNANTADLFFSLEDWHRIVLQGDSYISGYDFALEDLTDLFDEEDADGVALRDKFLPYTLDLLEIEVEVDGEWEAKNFIAPYAASATGLVYNVNLFDKYDWELPRTTDELIALCDEIKNTTGDDGKKIIPLVNETTTGYMSYILKAFMAQYDGIEEYYYFYNPITEGDGWRYQKNSLKGILYANMVSEQLYCPTFGRLSSTAQEDDYGRAQGRLISNQGAMMVNGDWFDNEMSIAISQAKDEGNNYKSGMMKTPVISMLVDQLTAWSSVLPGKVDYEEAMGDPASRDALDALDAFLADIVDYVDGVTTTVPSFTFGGSTYTATTADIEKVREARGVYFSLGTGHTAVIPAYATAKEAAKNFLRLLYSDTGAEIFLSKTVGGQLPVRFDVESWDGYQNASIFQKDIYEIIQNGNVANHPNEIFYSLPGPSAKFANYQQNNANYKGPRAMYEEGCMTQNEYLDFMRGQGLL